MGILQDRLINSNELSPVLHRIELVYVSPKLLPYRAVESVNGTVLVQDFYVTLQLHYFKLNVKYNPLEGK